MYIDCNIDTFELDIPKENYLLRWGLVFIGIYWWYKNTEAPAGAGLRCPRGSSIFGVPEHGTSSYGREWISRYDLKIPKCFFAKDVRGGGFNFSFKHTFGLFFYLEDAIKTDKSKNSNSPHKQYYWHMNMHTPTVRVDNFELPWINRDRKIQEVVARAFRENRIQELFTNAYKGRPGWSAGHSVNDGGCFLWMLDMWISGRSTLIISIFI